MLLFIESHKNVQPKLYLWMLAFLLGTPLLSAQNFILTGQVQDSLQQPVANANIIATPQKDGVEITFAISDQKGAYQLKLAGEVWYKIEITSLGFSALTDSIKLTKDAHKVYTLDQNYEALEQVVVEAKMAMIVKEDTITYRTDKFKTGDERKLREILKKLPGVEVDRDGNVSVNGKKVSKLMVDGRDFFGGDVKLGVNNIPADAVDEVEAIDDYHEVSFMKGLSDSDRMAMNIKLKKDKKHFVFGESEGGGGTKDRYYIHPALFYYSPETTLNFIGSFNNINKSPLDWQDVVRFKGGYSSMMDSPIQSGDAALSQFSNKRDILHNKMLFGAANFTQKLAHGLHLEAYSLVAQQKSRTQTATNIDYLAQDNLHEDRLNRSETKDFTNFNKVKLRYQPNPQTDMAYHLLANVNNSENRGQLRSRFADSLSQTFSGEDPHHLEINQFFRYNAQPSYEHTSEIKAKYSYKRANELTDWDFDKPVFSDIIPVEEDGGRYNFLHNYTTITNTGQASFKHYWVLNNTNHIYPKAGLYFFNQSYQSTDYQQLQNGDINSFAPAGFDNNLGYQLIDPYLGFQYKIKLGEIIFRPGVFYHYYLWRADQFDQRIADEHKGVFLPEFKLEHKFSTSKRIIFNYHLKSSFAEATSYANRYRLTGFNSLYRGNKDLENELYHSFSLNYRSFSMSKGINYYVNLGYNRREKSIRSSTDLEGIDQIMTSIYSKFPENNYSFAGSFNKRWQHYSAGISSRVSFSDYSRFINDEKLAYKSQNYTYGLSARTIYQDLPNLEIGVQHTLSFSKSTHYDADYQSVDPFVALDYTFLNGFIFKADYKYSYTKDNSAAHGKTFQIGNLSLYYNKEDSPWGFEIRVDNLFDVTYKRFHTFDRFMVYDQRIYIQSRTALFIVSYRL